jgi:zinc/manganese transport system permease protein
VPIGLLGVSFLVVVALATAMTVPVVGALLIFSLLIGPPAAARAVLPRPGAAIALSVVLALLTVWLSIAGSYETNWPVGFFVGMASAAWYLAGRVVGPLLDHVRRSTRERRVWVVPVVPS